MVGTIELVEVPLSTLADKNEILKHYKDAFPIIGTPFFSLNLRKVFSINDNGVEKGLVFSHRLSGKFKKIGNYDYSILIFSQYQNQGVGRWALNEIISMDESGIFLVPNKNTRSLGLLNSFDSLKSFQFGQISVFQLSK